ncbi:cyclin-dependent protein kinase inhibitor SMR3-like [Corylus avellana]|uniref:cyclin-dependent protein kinase inhibitor SMR3-like n=1 Tax=Corylus avellana TaxID=13451 RepID=UPI00286BB60D|nr:cyclin-dependent protein kinase inhibitor SMR3-like [Corylus avellana]
MIIFSGNYIFISSIFGLHMYSDQFKSLSFMGVSDSQMFLSEKDLNAMEFNFLVPPTLEFQEDHQKPEEEEEEEEKKKKKIKIPSVIVGKFRDVEDDEDGFKTPTSLDHKIPVILQCPPAPRKPKTIPLTKRKATRQRILLDLSNDIEALFPPALLVDLSRGKIKKIRQEQDETIS